MYSRLLGDLIHKGKIIYDGALEDWRHLALFSYQDHTDTENGKKIRI
jgi:hypothetical protein